jgi:hypothetical protein
MSDREARGREDDARGRREEDSSRARAPRWPPPRLLPSSPRARALLHAAAVPCLYALFFAIFFSPAVAGRHLFAPGDGTHFFVPNFYGPRVWWDTMIWAGTPRFADPQAMFWYPPHLVCRLLPRGWNLFMLSAYTVAASATYGYVFRLTRSRLAATVSGTTYALCGFMIAHAVHASMIHAAAWLPLFVWSLEEVGRGGGRRARAWFVAGAASVALSALAGHPQIFLYSVALGACVALFGARGAAQGASRYLALCAALVLAGTALAAIQLVPTAELTRLTPRAEITFDLFTAYSLPPRQLATLVFPLAYGGAPHTFYALPYFGVWSSEGGGWNASEITGYVGLLPLLLAAAALCARGRRGHALFWCGVAAVALLLALGSSAPLSHVAYRLPPFNKFRAPARHLLELSFAASVLAGLGVAAIARGLVTARRLKLVAACALAAALATLAALAIFRGQFDAQARAVVGRGVSLAPWKNPATGVPLLVLAAACAVLIFWSRRAGSRARSAALLAVLVCDLGSLAWFSEWRGGSPTFADFAPPPVAERLRGAVAPQGQRVLAARGGLGAADEVPPEQSRLWRVPGAGGYGPLMLARTSRLLSLLPHGAVVGDWADNSDRALDAFAVRYVTLPSDGRRARDAAARQITTSDLRPEDADASQHVADASLADASRWRVADATEDARVFENMRARPRAWLASEVITLAPEDAFVAVKTSRLPDGRAFDPARTALVEEPQDSPTTDDGSKTQTGDARVVAESDGRIEVRTESASPSFLVLSDVNYPGWRASIDGREAHVYQTDYALRGVHVPAGTHSVAFELRPRSFRVGFAVSLAALAALALFVAPFNPLRRARRATGRDTGNDEAAATGDDEAANDDEAASQGDEAGAAEKPHATRRTSPAAHLRACVLRGVNVLRSACVRRRASHAVAVVGFYALVFTLFFSPVLFSSRILAPGDGFNFHAPFFYSGRTLWQPLLWGGYPLAADPQAMAWYPVALLFSLVPHSYDAFVVSAYVLAASFAYGYARAVTRSTVAALAAGLVYGMCGFLSAQLGHASLVHTAAWAPAIFWSLESLRHRATATRFAACAASVASAALAGHFQIFAYTFGLALLYVVVLGWLTDDGELAARRIIARRVRRIAPAISALALGVAASAVQLIPTYELTAQGQRVRMSFADFVSFSLPPRHLLRLFFPYAFGGSPGSFYAVPYFDVWGPPVGGWGATELALYVGVLPLALALVGLASHRRSRVAWFWAAAGALALALSAGDALPLARLVFRLPAYDKFRVPARHLFELALAASALAGLGVAAIERRGARARIVRLALAVTGSALAACLAALWLMTGALREEAARAGVPNLSFAPWRNPATLAPLVVFALGASALAFWSRRTTSRFRRALLLAALALDLASFGWFYEWHYASPESSALAPPAAVARYAQTLSDAHQRLLPARGVLTPPDGGPPNVSALWRLPSASGYSALILARTARLLDMTNDGAVAPGWREPADRGLDLFAVRYVAAPLDDGVSPADGETGGATTHGPSTPTAPANDDPRVFSEGVEWGAADLGVALGKGCDAARADAAEFTPRAPARADSVALVTALACSAAIRDGAPVIRVTATDDHGGSLTEELRAGADTSEWAHDCPDVLPTVAHRRARVFESYTVGRAGARCEGHSYLARLSFARPIDVHSLRLEWIGGAGSADVKKISLIDGPTSRATPVEPSERVDTSRWRRVEDAGGVTVFENLRARPRAWLVKDVVTLSAEDALKAIKTSRLPDGRAFDPARMALVEEAAPSLKTLPSQTNGMSDPTQPPGDVADAAEATGAVGILALSRESDTAISLRATARAYSFLVLSDVYYPGWRASVDGREVHIYQTDYALRGVVVPPGAHRIEFVYAPRSLRAGAAVSALSVAAVALVSLLLARRERKRGSPDAAARVS